MFYRQEFLGLDGLVVEIEDYIRWYNTERISLKLQCLTPMEYRAQAPAA